ncbi:amino acid ABC transporter permease [Glycomyces salinus]|uniref:amino acid ABC transporter permease n=1 Tax=Glycomyces salinus TaxID=980294 RepID=UPI0018ED5E6E|nr:amino acid ABC transporter permease [Glycomyces salinus]
MDWQIVIDSLPRYAEPLWVTVQVTLGSAAVALFVAFGLGLMTSSKHLIVRTPARIVVEFFRGSSVIVQLFWFAYAMPQLLGFQFDYAIMVGIMALGLNYGSYSSEVVRAAIGAVPKGQWEAATALSLSPWTRTWRVVIPQAWPEMIPSLTSFAVMLLKASALVSMVSIIDLTAMANTIGRVPGNELLVQYGFLLVVYFILAWLIWSGMRLLERRAKRGIGIGARPSKKALADGHGVQASGGAM